MSDVYHYPTPLREVTLGPHHRLLVYAPAAAPSDFAIGHLCTEWPDSDEPDSYLRTWEAINLDGFVMQGAEEAVTVRPTIAHSYCGLVGWVTDGAWQDSVDFPPPDGA